MHPPAGSGSREAANMESTVDFLMKVNLLHPRVRYCCSIGAFAIPLMLGIEELIAFTAATASPNVTRTSGGLKARKQFFTNREMMKNSGALVNQFELSAARKTTTSPIEIKGFSFVASYNWSNSDDPVIFVPGTTSFHFVETRDTVLTLDSRMSSKMEPSYSSVSSYQGQRTSLHRSKQEP